MAIPGGIFAACSSHVTKSSGGPQLGTHTPVVVAGPANETVVSAFFAVSDTVLSVASDVVALAVIVVATVDIVVDTAVIVVVEVGVAVEVGVVVEVVVAVEVVVVVDVVAAIEVVVRTTSVATRVDVGDAAVDETKDVVPTSVVNTRPVVWEAQISHPVQSPHCSVSISHVASPGGIRAA